MPWCLRGSSGQRKAGLESFATPRYDQAQGKEQRQLVQIELRAIVEEERSSRAVGMRHQCAWTRWKQSVEGKILWTDLWQLEPHCVRFQVQAAAAPLGPG